MGLPVAIKKNGGCGDIILTSFPKNAVYNSCISHFEFKYMNLQCEVICFGVAGVYFEVF